MHRAVGKSAPATTIPLLLIPMAELKVPPRAPRSTMPPAAVHENAWEPSAVKPVPGDASEWMLTLRDPHSIFRS